MAKLRKRQFTKFHSRFLLHATRATLGTLTISTETKRQCLHLLMTNLKAFATTRAKLNTVGEFQTRLLRQISQNFLNYRMKSQHFLSIRLELLQVFLFRLNKANYNTTGRLRS